MEGSGCGFGEFLVADGFEQIVECVDFEALHGVIVVGGGEYDACGWRHDACEFKAVELWHVDVEEDEVDLAVDHLLDCFLSGREGAGVDEIRSSENVAVYELGCERFIVYYATSDFFHENSLS